MISGLFLRHYSVYKNINYIPLSDGENFTSLIGENGVGKSSILDSLDKFFNQRDSREWIINKQARQEGGISTKDKAPFICPVFLIPKSETSTYPDNLRTFIEAISDFLWSAPKKTSFDDFFKHLEYLKHLKKNEDFHIFLIGKRHEEKDAFFFGFENEFKKTVETTTDLDFALTAAELLQHTIDSITYLYIPVETNVSTFSKLEEVDMQILMDKNIQTEVGKAISDTIVRGINSDLDAFVKQIEQSLPQYTYKATGNKKKLTKLDIVQKTIEAYFSIQVLHKTIGASDIAIQHLSSGEKRRALVDLAYSFLVNSEDERKDVVLAIDEPETSLHIEACFEQFEKLREITQKQTQLIITTHWYGHLPISSSGKSILIAKNEEEIAKYAFNLANYREEMNAERDRTKGPLPYSIQMKSYNDLTQSMVASMQNGYNWIVCEGSSEKIYLEHYLSSEIKSNKLRILPAGGAPEVLRIAKYLQAPLQDKSMPVTGAALCLIDTDRDAKDFSKDQSIKSLHVKRLFLKDDDVVLVEIEDPLSSPCTEIEDSLSPITYIDSLKALQHEDIAKINFLEAITTSAKISAKALDLKASQQDALKVALKIPGLKYRLAELYVKNCKENPDSHIEPNWINEVRSALNLATKNSKPAKELAKQTEPSIKTNLRRKRPTPQQN